MVEEIFAGLQPLAEMPVAEERERQLAAYHVVAAQNCGDAPARGAVRDVHEDFLGPMAAIRTAELRIKPAGAAAQCGNQKERQNPEPPHPG